MVFDEGPSPHRSTDWALPAVFLSASVDPDLLRRERATNDPASWIANYITAYRLERQPAFCNRQNFFQSYFDLFEQDSKGVAGAYATDQEMGLGRTRLLEELAMPAIRDGNVYPQYWCAARGAVRSVGYPSRVRADDVHLDP